MRFRNLAAAAVAALCLLLSASMAQAASKKIEIAVQDDGVFLHNQANQAAVFQAATQLKTSFVRINVYYDPKDRTPDFSNYDRAIAEAKKRGIQAELTLTGQSATSDTKVRTPNVAGFGRFVKTAVTHFKDQGVPRYSIWNEPNYAAWLPTRRAVSLYRQLYVVGYKAIKRADPRAQVLIGELAPRANKKLTIAPLTFLRGITCVTPAYKKRGSCTPLKADGFADHPYTINLPPNYTGTSADDVTTGSLKRLTDALDKLAKVGALTTVKGKKALDIYVTEYGFLTKGSRMVPVSTRARYLKAGFQLMSLNKRVRQILFYQLAQGTGAGTFDTSLLDENGKPQKPFIVLKAAIARASARGKIAAAKR